MRSRRSTCLLALILLIAPIAHAKPRALTIVALGDSTTSGTPFFRSPLEAPPGGSGDPQGQYGYWMMHRHPEWDVVNCGIAGQRSDEIRARFDDTAQYHAQYVIILAGVNDIFQDTPLEEIEKNLAWMYKQAMLKETMPIAATVLPFDRATPDQSKAIDELNKWIIKKARDIPIPLINLHAVVAHPNDPQRLNGSPDGMHPDVGGYRQMGMALAALVEKLEREKNPSGR
jgi:lysophospholipase L1-like esterase